MGKTIRRERAYFDDEENHRRFVKQKRKNEQMRRQKRHTQRQLANTAFESDEDQYDNSVSDW